MLFKKTAFDGWFKKKKNKLLIQALPSFLPCFFFPACGNEPRYCRCSPASQSFRGKCWSLKMGTPSCLATWCLSLFPFSQSCGVILWERSDWEEWFQERQHKWIMAEACSGLLGGWGGGCPVLPFSCSENVIKSLLINCLELRLIELSETLCMDNHGYLLTWLWFLREILQHNTKITLVRWLMSGPLT